MAGARPPVSGKLDSEMGYVDDIIYSETISKQRIIPKSKWLDLFDVILFVIADIFFIICLALTFSELSLSQPNDRFIGYGILPLALILALVFLYKKLREKRLLIIETKLDKKTAREQVVTLLKSWDWNIKRNNANYLQATTGFDLTWGNQVTVIYAKGKLLLNVMADNPMVRMPVFFADKTIKMDIESGLKPAANSAQSRQADRGSIP